MSRNVRATGKVIDGLVVVRQQFCDGCMTAAYDEGMYEAEEQYALLATASDLLPDHQCDHVEEPDVPCDCEAHRP